MPWRNTPENFFLRYGAARGHAQEPTLGSAFEFLGESMRKNRPLVPRSNITGSKAHGGGGYMRDPKELHISSRHCQSLS